MVPEVVVSKFLQVRGLLDEELGWNGQEQGRYFYLVFIQALEDDDKHYNINKLFFYPNYRTLWPVNNIFALVTHVKNAKFSG